MQLMMRTLRRMLSMNSGLDYVCFDLETTGFSPNLHDILEIGAWKFNKDGVKIGEFRRLIKPTRLIPPEVIKLTGITDEDVKDCESIQEVLPEFFDFCDGCILVGYNLCFDYSFLLTKGRPLGLDFSLDGARLGLDVLKYVKKYSTFDSYKLVNVMHYLGINLQGNAHRASYDAYVTKLVLDRYPSAVEYRLDSKDYGEAQDTGQLSLK